LDLDADTYTNRVTFEIKDNTVFILEGVLLFRPPIDGLIDYRIFLDVSFDDVSFSVLFTRNPWFLQKHLKTKRFSQHFC
jgi:uridine kinase